MTEEPHEPQPSAFWTTAKSFLRRAGRFFGWLAEMVYRRGRKSGAFYWSQRRAFWAYFSEYSPGLQEPKIVRKEIRFSTDEDSKLARYSKEGWVVEMPNCCVVCGEPSDCKWINETRWVDNLGKPFWIPIAAIGVGLLLSLFYQAYWILLVAIFFGFLLGNLQRSSIRVDLKFQRCKVHEEKTSVPHVRLFGEQLILRLGGRSARQAVRDKTQVADDTLVGTHKQTIPTSNPEPIPLADGVTSEIEHEGTTPLASDELPNLNDTDSDWTTDGDGTDDSLIDFDDDTDD